MTKHKEFHIKTKDHGEIIWSYWKPILGTFDEYQCLMDVCDGLKQKDAKIFWFKYFWHHLGSSFVFSRVQTSSCTKEPSFPVSIIEQLSVVKATVGRYATLRYMADNRQRSVFFSLPKLCSVSRDCVLLHYLLAQWKIFLEIFLQRQLKIFSATLTVSVAFLELTEF